MTPQPYYSDEYVSLYHGDMREVLPALGMRYDACLTDPPYAETSLAWDRWPDGWPSLVAQTTNSMWCFGSMRMFLDRRDEYADWQMSQDLVWEKDEGTGLATDRFRRVHEYALHWYHGPWSGVHHDTPRERHYGPDNGRRTKGGSKGAHIGEAGTRPYVDDGRRLARSVRRHPRVRGGIHPTQKPVPLVADLITYAVPAGGRVLDPFGGSCTTGYVARQLGRRAVVIEGNEAMCAKAAARLAAPDLLTGITS